MAKTRNESLSPRIANRKALHDYHVLEKLEVGIVLTGSEVKSIRNGQAQLAQAFAQVSDKDLSLTLIGADIAPYTHAHGPNNHERTRPRRLLAHKRQILKLLTQTASKGNTLVPLAMYFVRGKVKVEMALVTGKHRQDKRQDMKNRDAQRDIQRAMTRKRL
ncbi:MAG: SsrA-binding protein SmpB [Phycisphaera sp.]|nr:SsrA-binding protein SmpB [Phycisphaera sp.]